VSSIIISERTRSLVVPRAGAVVTMFPEAKQLVYQNEAHIVLPHGVREQMILKRLGYKSVPNPITKYYDWPGGKKPFAVQMKTCAMLTENPRAYVLNHMGTGKTKSALWAWDWLFKSGICGKALVVAPLSTINFVWAREVFATLPHRRSQVLYKTRMQRLDRLRDLTADIYIINHDGVKTIYDDLLARTDIDTLIIDELAVYRNNNDRSKLMRKLAERFQWVWGMTGAPMPNEPTDVWGQAKIVTPSTVPKYRKHAEDMLMTRVNNFKLLPKPDAVETAFRMLQPAVRYSLDDVTELPDVVSRTIDVELTEHQKRAYRILAREFQIMIKDKTITALNAAGAMNKLLQVSTGWVYAGEKKDVVVIDNKTRMDTLIDLINANARKLLVFCPYRHAVEGISKLLDAADGGGIEHAVIHGDVSNRDHIFNLFQNTTKYKVLLAHPQCLAHGVTLTAADTIIWFSPTPSLEIYDQANARIRRIGQQHRQQILHLQSTPVERKLYKLLTDKADIQSQLLNMFETATENM